MTAIQVHTIRAAGKKEVPHGTEVVLTRGTLQGTARVRLKLPGQRKFSDLGDLPISNGIIELPVKLLFLSYAREDRTKVQRLANKLWQDGFLTWMDTKDLLPGDAWRDRIADAVERADYILIFLSQTSCTKVGYIQKEFKYALEQKELRPSGVRYIIPILLEPCDPPRELQNAQWLNSWEEGSYQRLKKALTN